MAFLSIDVFLIIFIGMGPIKALLAYLAMTQEVSTELQRKVARKAVFTATIVGILLLLAGALFMRILHFSRGALTVAGGLILLLLALNIVLSPAKKEEHEAAPSEAALMSSAIYPLAIPLLLNPIGIVGLTVFSAESQTLLDLAVILGMLGCIDALLTSVVADSLTRTRHNSDKELIGQGVGNVMSGLFGGMPGAGATMGTVVNIQAGARTALSGLIRAGILLVVVLWAGGLTATIPLAVLAAIALKVGIDIIDWGFLKRAHRISGKGAFITYSVIALTVFVDLIAAVGIGLFVANIMTVTRLSRMQSDDVKAVTNPQDTDLALTPDERKILSAASGRVLLLHLRGSMNFGASRVISRKNSEVEGIETLIVDVTDVVYLGVSAALAIEEAVLDMINAGRSVYIVAAPGQPRQRLEDVGILQRIPRQNVVEKRLAALKYSVYGARPQVQATGASIEGMYSVG